MHILAWTPVPGSVKLANLMLDFLHNLARRLHWLQPLAVVTGLLSLLAIAYAGLTTPARGDPLLIPAILGLCWSLVLYSLVGLFVSSPPQVDPLAGYFQRLGSRLRRGLKTLLALAFALLTLVLLWLSFKLLTTGVG